MVAEFCVSIKLNGNFKHLDNAVLRFKIFQID